MLIESHTIKELKDELHKQVESLNKAQLMEVYRFISKMVGEKLMEAMRDEELSRDAIRDAITEYRQKHPYGNK